MKNVIASITKFAKQQFTYFRNNRTIMKNFTILFLLGGFFLLSFINDHCLQKILNKKRKLLFTDREISAGWITWINHHLLVLIDLLFLVFVRRVFTFLNAGVIVFFAKVIINLIGVILFIDLLIFLWWIAKLIKWLLMIAITRINRFFA